MPNSGIQPDRLDGKAPVMSPDLRAVCRAALNLVLYSGDREAQQSRESLLHSRFVHSDPELGRQMQECVDSLEDAAWFGGAPRLGCGIAFSLSAIQLVGRVQAIVETAQPARVPRPGGRWCW